MAAVCAALHSTLHYRRYCIEAAFPGRLSGSLSDVASEGMAGEGLVKNGAIPFSF